MTNKEIQEKSYNIKIPVYTTTMLNQDVGLFENVSFQDMIQMIKKRLNNFKNPISSSNRNKTKKTVVSSISYKDIKIGDVPALLLQISAFNTNMYDGYFEANEKIPITKDNKLGSETNFVLLYPRIKGLSAETYTCFFLMLVYEDPTKDNGEVCKLAKILVNKILNIPIENIKLPMIFDELKDICTIPELQIRYRSISDADNDVDVKYREFLQGGKLEKKKDRLFKNMPREIMEQLLADTTDDEDYQYKDTRIVIGKKEYRIKKELVNEASKELKETAEKIFNASSAITQTELDTKIHDTNFMIEKLSGVLTNYLSNE
jgi:hypothetical protein